MTKFLIVGFIILPWVIIPLKGVADSFRIPQATFLNLIFMGMICHALYRGLKVNYRNKFLSLFAVWVFITIFFSWYLPFTMTFNNLQAINIVTLQPTLHFILGLFATFVALSYFEKEDYERIAKGICFSAVLVTLFGIMQVTGFDPFGKIATYNHPNHFAACLDNPNVIGNYLCLSLPLFFCFKGKYIWGGLLVAVGVILSKSELSIACMVIGLCFYAFLNFRKNKRVKIAVIAVVFLSGIFCFQNRKALIDLGVERRLDVWKKSVEIIRVNPLFGQGLGKFKAYEVDFEGTKALTLHNDWLERVVEIGVLGVILLVLIVGNSFRNFDYKKATSLGLSYLTSFLMFILLMGGSFPVEIAPTMLLGLIGFWGVERI